ncbi:MAG: hypothetical protein ABIU77_01380 [Ferruginibacter sp.]
MAGITMLDLSYTLEYSGRTKKERFSAVYFANAFRFWGNNETRIFRTKKNTGNKLTVKAGYYYEIQFY